LIQWVHTVDAHMKSQSQEASMGGTSRQMNTQYNQVPIESEQKG